MTHSEQTGTTASANFDPPKVFYELNLRLDVIGAKNTDDEIDSQLKKALTGLRGLGTFEYRRASYSTRLGRFHFFVARVHAKDWDTHAIHKLSVRLGQKCISVYSEATQHGELIGPNTTDYNQGRFDLRYFNRFDQEAERRAQEVEEREIDAAMRENNPAFEVLVDVYRYKVFERDEWANTHPHAKATFERMLRRRLLSKKPPPTVDEVDGFKILTLDCLYHTPGRPQTGVQWNIS